MPIVWETVRFLRPCVRVALLALLSNPWYHCFAIAEDGQDRFLYTAWRVRGQVRDQVRDALARWQGDEE